MLWEVSLLLDSNSPNSSAPKYVFQPLHIPGEIMSCGFIFFLSTESTLRFMLFKFSIKCPFEQYKNPPKVFPFLTDSNSQGASINCWPSQLPLSILSMVKSTPSFLPLIYSYSPPSPPASDFVQ